MLFPDVSQLTVECVSCDKTQQFPNEANEQGMSDNNWQHS